MNNYQNIVDIAEKLAPAAAKEALNTIVSTIDSDWILNAIENVDTGYTGEDNDTAYRTYLNNLPEDVAKSVLVYFANEYDIPPEINTYQGANGIYHEMYYPKVAAPNAYGDGRELIYNTIVAQSKKVSGGSRRKNRKASRKNRKASRKNRSRKH